MSKFFLRIATPEGEIYSGQIDYLCAPATDGKIGFMKGALPGIYALSAGTVEITDDDRKLKIACGDGILSVDGDGLTVLTSSSEEPLFVEDAKSEKTHADVEQDYAKAKIMSNLYKMKNGDGKKDV